MTGAAGPNEEPTSGDRRPRVLIADDESTIAATLRAILSLEGFDVVTAANGEEAVRKAREWRPDLLLSDVVMPGMDGVTASIEIRKFLPDCKVVLLSAHPMASESIRAARERGYDFEVMLKPIHPVELIEHLRKILGVP